MIPDETWREVAPIIFDERSIVSITTIEDSDGSRITYVASTPQPDPESLMPIETTIHWHLEGTSLGWEPLPPIAQIVNTLAVVEPTDRDLSANARAELYAGTPEGLYAWNRLDGWQRVGGTTGNVLLAAAPSGLYAGDSTVIRHRIESTARWKPFAVNKKGITDTYRDEPIVQQIRAYLTERIPTIAQTGGVAVRWVSGFVGSIAFSFGGFLATLLLAFVVFIYANQSFDNYFHDLVSLLPEQRRNTVKSYLREIDKNLQQFLERTGHSYRYYFSDFLYRI